MNYRWRKVVSNVQAFGYFRIRPEPGVVAHACNPITWESETGLRTASANSETLINLVRPFFKIKIKKLGLGCSLEVECP